MLDDKSGIVVDINNVEMINEAISEICEKKNCSDIEYIFKYSKRFDMRDKFAEYIELYSTISERQNAF